ncbi:MAG: flagellar biosynthesis protein FlhB [Alphaproteobacteria bacterium]|nr:flagellar biosynthesis protein FlhB [Alphaproteobacteria bacterium]
MADADQDSKTEEPTGRRLADARRRGQLPTSREVPTWVLLAGAAIMIALAGPSIAGGLRDAMVGYLQAPHGVLYGPGELSETLEATLITTLGIVGVPLAVFALLAGGSFLVQNGWVVSTEPIKPKLSKINPISGAKRFIGAKMYVEFVRNLLKMSIVAVVGLLMFLPEFERVSILPRLEFKDHLDEIMIMVLRILAGVLAVHFVIMIFDIFYQRYEHRKQLRMTKQEIKEEFKNSEGDPQVKARLRSIRTKRAMSRMMQAVPEADVVVTNPTHFACALSYKPDEGMSAPVLVAKGQDLVAQRIRVIAEENEITIVENPPLARALFAACEIDQEVPEEHYRAVAEVISYVWSLKGRHVN